MTTKEELIEKLIPEVLNSFTLDDLKGFVASRLETEWQYDFDMLIEDAITFGLIEDESELSHG